MNLNVSIPQSGLQAFRHFDDSGYVLPALRFQSLNRAYKRSDSISICHQTWESMFQSLNRAYKRSDICCVPAYPKDRYVSIPQSGLQAFRQSEEKDFDEVTDVFQSLNRAYKRSDHRCPFACQGMRIRFNPSIGLTSVPT